MDILETRELRYFLAVAEELHFGRAAERLGMAQPPLSRAIQRLERRLGVSLLTRNRRGVALTGAGEMLLYEGRAALDAITAAARRARRAGGADDPRGPRNRLVLAVKAAASHELLHKLLDAYAAEPDAAEIDVLPSGTCEQEEMLRDGRADVALMHKPFNSLTGFDSEELMTEGQIAILPAGHPLAAHKTLSLADVSDIPDLPLARWSRDGTFPPGPGPEIHDQTQAGPADRPRTHRGRLPRLRPRLAMGRAHRRPPDRRTPRRHSPRVARAQPLPRPRGAGPHSHTAMTLSRLPTAPSP